MLTRHAARELSLQSLFNLDSRYDLQKATKENQSEVYENIRDSLYENAEEDEFSEKMLFGIIKNLDAINEIIIKATPDWGIEKTAIIDRNILRVAIYEMLFSDVDVPPRVVINEAIELAKTFGHKKSFKFISGVLGAVYEATGLKEKDKKSSKNKSDDDYKNAPVEGKVGAVVFSKKDENIYLAFVHDMFGYWTLSKGSLEEKDKDIESGVKRKVQEEMGIEIKVLEKLGENNYRAKSEDNKPINRAVIYFLAQSEYTDLVLEKDNKGLNNAKWINIDDVMDLKLYDDLIKIIEKGIDTIKKKYE